MNFINKGSDYNCLKSLSRQGLVQKEVQVQGKHGTYIRKQWVSSGGKETSVKTSNEDYHSKKASKSMYFPLEDSGELTTRAFSYADIISYYGKHKSEIKDTIQNFVKKNYFISDGHTQTQDFYKSSKGYTKSRKKLHNKIIQNILNQANSPKNGEKPIAVLMGGGSASGKGTLRSTLIVPRLKSAGINVGISDCDDIKEQLPEYAHFKKQDPSSAAMRVHEESMDIAMDAMDELIKNNKNLLFDGTMKDVNKYSKIIDKLHKAGYQIQIIGTDVPVDLAIKRSNNRARKTGRKVPEGIIRGSHGGFAMTYPQLISKVDGYSLYDNSGDHPVLVQDEKRVYKPELLSEFTRKGENHKVQKTIQRISKTYGVSRKDIQDLYENGAGLDEIEEYFQLGLDS